MSEDKVTRINVGGHATGIIGLQPILEEVANEFAGRTDDEIKAELLNRLSQKKLHQQYNQRCVQPRIFKRIQKVRRRTL